MYSLIASSTGFSGADQLWRAPSSCDLLAESAPGPDTLELAPYAGSENVGIARPYPDGATSASNCPRIITRDPANGSLPTGRRSEARAQKNSLKATPSGASTIADFAHALATLMPVTQVEKTAFSTLCPPQLADALSESSFPPGTMQGHRPPRRSRPNHGRRQAQNEAPGRPSYRELLAVCSLCQFARPQCQSVRARPGLRDAFSQLG